jgi:hypothetical protein
MGKHTTCVCDLNSAPPPPICLLLCLVPAVACSHLHLLWVCFCSMFVSLVATVRASTRLLCFVRRSGEAFLFLSARGASFPFRAFPFLARSLVTDRSHPRDRLFRRSHPYLLSIIPKGEISHFAQKGILPLRDRSSRNAIKIDDYCRTFSTAINVFNASRVSPSDHLSSGDDHSIPHPARPSAGWCHPPRFPYMRARNPPTDPHENTSTSTLILGRKITGRR